MKIKAIVKSETTVEVDIELPYFSKINDNFFKLFGENEWDCIVVSYPGTSCCCVRNTLVSGAIKDTEKITQEEFDFAFKTAMDYLNLLNYTLANG